MASRDRDRVWGVVQARTSSTRLPGKVLADLGPGRTIELVLRRLLRARELAGVIVATSTARPDDDIVAAVEECGVPVLRGPLHDVLARYGLAARETDAAAIVRITADCPLVDPELVDTLVRIWRQGGAAYVANILEPRTFPKGLDVEVVSRAALEAADAEASSDMDREHVTPFIRERPERFPPAGLQLQPAMPESRVTLDTREDLDALRRIFEHLPEDAGLQEIVRALGAGPVSVLER